MATSATEVGDPGGALAAGVEIVDLGGHTGLEGRRQQVQRRDVDICANPTVVFGPTEASAAAPAACPSRLRRLKVGVDS